MLCKSLLFCRWQRYPLRSPWYLRSGYGLNTPTSYWKVAPTCRSLRGKWVKPWVRRIKFEGDLSEFQRGRVFTIRATLWCEYPWLPVSTVHFLMLIPLLEYEPTEGPWLSQKKSRTNRTFRPVWQSHLFLCEIPSLQTNSILHSKSSECRQTI